MQNGIRRLLQFDEPLKRGTKSAETFLQAVHLAMNAGMFTMNQWRLINHMKKVQLNGSLNVTCVMKESMNAENL